MKTESSMAFEDSVMSICGLNGKDRMDCLLSSLPSELTFNSLRDACRRHSKTDSCTGPALHSVASRSSMIHTFGCQPLTLSDQDWSTPIGRNQVKTSVHSALKSTQKELGINTEGLTRNPSSKGFTKPHIFAHRLQLLQCLAAEFKKFEGDDDAKRDHVWKLFQGVWVCKTVPEIWFLRTKGEDDLPEKCVITVRSGPFTLTGVKMVREGETYKLDEDPRTTFFPGEYSTLEVAQVKVVPGNNGGPLTWVIDGPWMGMSDYIADFGILTIPAAVLTLICKELGLKSGRLDHLGRAELFLKTMQRSDEWIEEVLAVLKAKQRKKKEKQEKKEDAVCC